MDNPKYSSLRIRRHDSLPLRSPSAASTVTVNASGSPLRRHATNTIILINSRRLGGTSKNSPYVGSFRHAPPTTFRSMAASENTTTHAGPATHHYYQYSTATDTVKRLGVVPPSPSGVFSSTSSSSSFSMPIRKKNSPYVGWFRHAPPSSLLSRQQQQQQRYMMSNAASHLVYLSNNSNNMRSTNHSKKNRSSSSSTIHKVDPDFLVEIDRWHQILLTTTTMLLLQESRHEQKESGGYKYLRGGQNCGAASSAAAAAALSSPPFQQIINGRLVGGNGKDRWNKRSYVVGKRMRNDSASASFAAGNVLARMTSWLLFPLLVDDSLSLCDDKPAGLKLVHSTGEEEASKESFSDDDNDDDDSMSSSTSVSLSDLPTRSPVARTQVDLETEREFSEMNVSVSEIAEAYYAHHLIDQERRQSNCRPPRDIAVGPKNRSGLLVNTYNEDDSVMQHGVPAFDHRLDYEITQMDIARMARNASRHLDVDSILNLPTVTYQSRMALPRHKELLKEPRQLHTGNRPTVCLPARSTSGKAPEDGWSFVMVSGIKSSIMDASYVSPRMGQEDAEEEVCVICLEAFRHGDRLRVLPCDHSFHVGCIDRWLCGSHSYNECVTTGCPTCKKQPAAAAAQYRPIGALPAPAEVTDEDHVEQSLDGSVPSWAFAKLGSALAMSQQGC